MPKFNLTPAMAPYLGRHLLLPLLEFLQLKRVYGDAPLLKAKFELLSNTHMLDYAIEIYKDLYHTEDVPPELLHRRSKVIMHSVLMLEELEPLICLLRSRSDRLPEIGQPQMEALYEFAVFQYECGNYAAASDYLRHYRKLSDNKERGTVALWGQLASQILMQNWDVALQDFMRLKELVDSKANCQNYYADQLQHRTWLLHWALFVFFRQEDVRKTMMIIDLFLQESYLETIRSNVPHLLRYLAAVCIVNNSRILLSKIRKLVKLIQTQSQAYKDPITSLLECIYVHHVDFEMAHRTLRQCEELIVNDYFLGGQVEKFRDAFFESAQILLLDTYRGTVHQSEKGNVSSKLARHESCRATCTV